MKIIYSTKGENFNKIRDKFLRKLCDDLDYLIREDKAIREEIIDEYVYLLNDKRLVELQEYVKQELYADH